MLVLEAEQDQPIERLVFSRDGRKIAAGNWNRVFCWNLDSPSSTTTHAAEAVNCLAYLPDGQLLIGTIDEGVQIVRSDGEILDDSLGGGKSRFIAASPDSLLLLQSDFGQAESLRCFRLGDSPPVEWLWSIQCDVQHTPVFVSRGEQIAIPYSAFSRNSDSGEITGGIRFHDVRNGRRIRTVPLPHALPHLAVSGDDRWLASTYGNQIRCWNAGRKSRNVERVDNDSGEQFCGIAFHPSNRYLAAASNDNTIKLYRLANWEVEKTYAWDIGRMRSIAFSPDGTLAAAGGDRGWVVVWDLEL